MCIKSKGTKSQYFKQEKVIAPAILQNNVSVEQCYLQCIWDQL